MFTYDDNFFFEKNSNRIAFLCDSEADLPFLPTTTSYGDITKVSGGSNVMIEPVDAGSMAHSIATSKNYILNSGDVWKEFKRPGGGGSPSPVPTTTSLADLTDVQLGALIDGNALVYDESLSKWVNKDNINDFQTKTLDEPVIIAGHEYDSVEDALQGVTDMFVWQQV